MSRFLKRDYRCEDLTGGMVNLNFVDRRTSSLSGWMINLTCLLSFLICVTPSGLKDTSESLKPS